MRAQFKNLFSSRRASMGILTTLFVVGSGSSFAFAGQPDMSSLQLGAVQSEEALVRELQWIQVQPDAVARLKRKLDTLANEAKRTEEAIVFVTAARDEIAKDQEREQRTKQEWIKSREENRRFCAEQRRCLLTPRMAQTLASFEAIDRINHERMQLNADSAAERAMQLGAQRLQRERELVRLMQLRENIRFLIRTTDFALVVSEAEAHIKKEVGLAVQRGHKAIAEATQRALQGMDEVVVQKSKEIRVQSDLAHQAIQSTAVQAKQKTQEALKTSQTRLKRNLPRPRARIVKKGRRWTVRTLNRPVDAKLVLQIGSASRKKIIRRKANAVCIRFKPRGPIRVSYETLNARSAAVLLPN